MTPTFNSVDRAWALVEDTQPKPIHATWYLLYTGTSTDGRGPGVYVGRTTSKLTAYHHYQTERANPYSTGGVQIVTDTSNTFAHAFTDWDAF